MSITNEEIIADIQKALEAALDEIHALGIKYTTITHTSDSKLEVHRADGVAEIMAILINIRFGDEGSHEIINKIQNDVESILKTVH